MDFTPFFYDSSNDRFRTFNKFLRSWLTNCTMTPFFIGRTFVSKSWEDGNFSVREFIFTFFFHQKGQNRQWKSILLELVVIINESWYNQGYIFLIIELWSPISTFFDIKNNWLIMLVSWATKYKKYKFA